MYQAIKDQIRLTPPSTRNRPRCARGQAGKKRRYSQPEFQDKLNEEQKIVKTARPANAALKVRSGTWKAF
jgi:hypothetical protein